MMVSFPAGIVGVLTNNPSPSQLSFKVNNIAKVTNVLPNKQLITMLVCWTFTYCSQYGFLTISLFIITTILIKTKRAEGVQRELRGGVRGRRISVMILQCHSPFQYIFTLFGITPSSLNVWFPEALGTYMVVWWISS